MTDHDPTPWGYEPADRTIYDREGNKPVAFVECKRNVPILLAAPILLKALEQVLFRAHFAPEDEWIETAALDALRAAKGESK